MTDLRVTALGVAVLLAISAVFLQRASAAGFPILGIRVEGANRVGPDTILRVMESRVGGEFDPAKIRADVKAIYRMGYFSDVKIDAENEPGGLRLVVLVVEKPIVSSIVIEGNKEVDTSDLKEALTIKERSLFQEDKVKESARKLVEVCQNRGYYDATVVPSVQEEADGSIRVSFRVSEGEKLTIEKIRITGNQFMEEKNILKQMETKTKGFFSFITDSGTFKKDVLENDVRRIEALYQDNGFMDSKVSDPEIGRGPKGLVVTIHVFEGRQYRVGKVRFSGESGLSEEGQRKAVKLKEGDVFSRETLLSDILSLTTAMNDKGYALAIVSPLVEKRKEYPLADVMYKAEKGDKFRFGKVEVVGNTKTLDRVIRRNLDVADGMTYTATGLKKSKENLTRLSYFKDVKISTEPSKVPREMDVKVEVQEGPTGTLSGGLGFSTIDKVFGVVQLTENNLLGRGWKASLNSQFGSRRTLFSLDFRDPYFLDSDFSLLLSAYKLKTNYTDFERKSTGGKVGFGYSLNRDTTASLSFRLDEVEILDREDAVSPILQEEFAMGKQQTRSVTLNLTKNTTDKYIDPSRGTVQSVTVEYAGEPLGGDSDFVKYFLNTKAFFPVTKTNIISGNFLWGHTISTVGGTVPLYERFFLGGPYNIRGYKARTISPVDPNTDEEIGGNKELVVNVEYIFPIFGEFGLKGVFFFDMGNTWGQGQWPWDMKPWDGPPIRYAAGMGIRWYSPMGPLRIEWGWPLNPEPGEEKLVMEFTIGTAF
ncbi:MAG: outer membrane protein assembly factor BamA [Candidatus Deferrimicrobiaceae bacterium]